MPFSRSSSVFRFGFHKKQSLGSSSFGPFSNSYLPIKNHFLIESSSRLSSRCKIESYQRLKNLSLCFFSFGPPSKICYLRLHSLGSLTLLTHNSCNVCFNFGSLHYGDKLRFSTVSSSSEVQSTAKIRPEKHKLEKRNNFSGKFVLEIVDILRNNGNDLESRLNMLHSRLSTHSITEIFEVLNSERISGLRFFEWIWSNIPRLQKNAYICSLIIDNLGILDDDKTMYAWLHKFTCENICLTYTAFRFLPVLTAADSSLEESCERVVDLLNKVGGSCRSSGVCALIEMFCKLHMFEMAKYVIKMTERKYSYYCLLIREMCRSGLIEDAYSIIREMRKARCAPNTTVYNYVLGSLWKNGRMDEASSLLDEMKENGIPSDAITFEILINNACSLGNRDVVHQLLDLMVSQGLEPRPSTHACIIKTLFAAKDYGATYKHVVDSSMVYKISSNMMYSLMAKLYWERGDSISAQRTLVEMMEKSLKPDFIVYAKIMKQLRGSGLANLATDLESRYSKFVIESRVGRRFLS